jgi:hypothetical protein
VSEEQSNELAQLCEREREILIRDHLNTDMGVLELFFPSTRWAQCRPRFGFAVIRPFG